MLLCLVGACTAMLTMRGVQNRAIARMEAHEAKVTQQA
jgi:hypothetical protein